MRVTSAAASSNSLVASAASRPLCEPLRSEPGITRIFGDGMAEPDDGGQTTEDRLKNPPSSVVRHLSSVVPVDPHARRRDIRPDALGGFRLHAVERARDGGNRRI